MKASGGNGVIICAAEYFRITSGNRCEYVFKPRRFHKAHILAQRKGKSTLKTDATVCDKQWPVDNYSSAYCMSHLLVAICFTVKTVLVFL